MKKGKSNIPKKFQNVDSSFIDRLVKEEKDGACTGFKVFPKKLNFYGKDPKEEVVLLTRLHWLAYLPDLLLVLLFLLLPILLSIISSVFNSSISPALYTGLFVLGVLIALNVLVTAILKWFYSVIVITDRRFVVVSLKSGFYHSYSEAQLKNIEDVTHTMAGFWGNIFDIGNLDVDTAGHEIDFRLKMVPKPRELQDIINDLVEMKKKGKI